MKSYSLDLRQKIIDVREQEQMSIRKIAERFKVTKSFVQKLLKQYQETGDIQPKKRGGSPGRKLNDEQVATLIDIIDQHHDLTLKEVGELLEEKTQVKVGKTTLWKLLKSLGYSGKKRRCTPQRKITQYQKNVSIVAG